MFKRMLFILAAILFLCMGVTALDAQAKLPDLTITDILLDKECQVVVKVKNLGPSSVPDEVWTVHKPESSGVYLHINGKGWGGATIWGFDPGKSLQPPGGTAAYTSTLKVTGTATIMATVDHTKQVKEANEGNNERTEKLTCKAEAKDDFSIKISNCPSTAKAGQELGASFKVTATNHGDTAVKDVAVDIVLRSDTSCPSPAPFAIYSPNYSNGVLLKGGREHISLKPGQTADVKLNGTNTIPADIPTGSYYLCAVIDAGNKVKEVNEGNNCACCPIKIVPDEGKPDLVIRTFGLKEWGKCEPRHAVFTFEVTVANVGTVPSPAVTDFALVQARDTHTGINWENGVIIPDPIPPGGSKTVLIPLYYLIDNPTHMTAELPHPFKAFADPGNRVSEANEANNESPNVINVDPVSKGPCRK